MPFPVCLPRQAHKKHTNSRKSYTICGRKGGASRSEGKAGRKRIAGGKLRFNRTIRPFGSLPVGEGHRPSRASEGCHRPSGRYIYAKRSNGSSRSPTKNDACRSRDRRHDLISDPARIEAFSGSPDQQRDPCHTGTSHSHPFTRISLVVYTEVTWRYISYDSSAATVSLLSFSSCTS